MSKTAENIVSVEIEHLGYRGVGIGRHGGKVIMTPLTAPGDRAEIRIIRSHKRFDDGEVVEIQRPSALRTNPPCPHFGRCGGCQLQHIRAAEQRSLKESLFKELMSHNAQVPENLIMDILFTSQELGYRSSLGMDVRWTGETASLGFNSRGSREFVPVNCCILALPILRSLIPHAAKMITAGYAKYVTRAYLSCDAPGEGTVLVLCSSGRMSEATREPISRMACQVNGLRGVYLANRHGGAIRPIWRRKTEPLGVKYTVPGDPDELLLEAWPGVFRQANPSVNRVMVETLLRCLKNRGAERILDLYSGMGNLSLPLALIGKEVLGVEANAAAADNARTNARRVRTANVQWRRNSAEDALRALARARESFDTVVLDPPRRGARDILERVIAIAPEQILYVSCDPATLARDLRLLQRGPYKVIRSWPLDMFPQTFHLESITLLAATH